MSKASEARQALQRLPEVEGERWIEGWRAFHINYGVDAEGGEAPLLQGQFGTWFSAENEAVCEHNLVTMMACDTMGTPHQPECGLYSRKRPPIPTEMPSGGVVALVESGGMVYEYEHGYRAERCRIKHLWLIAGPPDGPGGNPLDLCRALARRYGVPCMPIESVWSLHREEGTYEEAVGIYQAETTRDLFYLWEERWLRQWILASLSGGTQSQSLVQPAGQPVSRARLSLPAHPLASPSQPRPDRVRRWFATAPLPLVLGTVWAGVITLGVGFAAAVEALIGVLS